MIDADNDIVLEILRQTIMQSVDGELSILSPVLLDIVKKMTEKEKNIDIVLACIDDKFVDKRDYMLPGILMIGSSMFSNVDFANEDNTWRFTYDETTKILYITSDFVSLVSMNEVRVGSVNDLQDMETFLHHVNVPEPYIENIA
eukprot:986869-Pleurochrysis_carterae.AAC.1